MKYPRCSPKNCGRHFLYVTILILTSVAHGAATSVPAYRVSVGGTKHSDTLQLSAAINLRAPQVFSIRNMEFALGTISSRTNDEVFISFGPTWRWPLGHRRLHVDFGISPTLVSGASFDGHDIGGNFHFTSFLSMGTNFGNLERSSISLRIQHTSNGGLNRANPGMDMVGLEFSFNSSE